MPLRNTISALRCPFSLDGGRRSLRAAWGARRAGAPACVGLTVALALVEHVRVAVLEVAAMRRSACPERREEAEAAHDLIHRVGLVHLALLAIHEPLLAQTPPILHLPLHHSPPNHLHNLTLPLQVPHHHTKILHAAQKAKKRRTPIRASALLQLEARSHLGVCDGVAGGRVTAGAAGAARRLAVRPKVEQVALPLPSPRLVRNPTVVPARRQDACNRHALRGSLHILVHARLGRGALGPRRWRVHLRCHPRRRAAGPHARVQHLELRPRRREGRRRGGSRCREGPRADESGERGEIRARGSHRPRRRPVREWRSQQARQGKRCRRVGHPSALARLAGPRRRAPPLALQRQIVAPLVLCRLRTAVQEAQELGRHRVKRYRRRRREKRAHKHRHGRPGGGVVAGGGAQGVEGGKGQRSFELECRKRRRRHCSRHTEVAPRGPGNL
mmetsp:Transcript_38630/g.93096  ORF Transcript_38630/g.93096 Transcript_38630/m.93096 type:complete len:444 (-) Transcript_38630:73-1404(-)